TPAPPDDGSTTVSCPVPRTRSSARWPCGACPAIIAGDSSAETAGGWVKHPGNPVLGGQYGTCFDVAVQRENEATACGCRGGQNGAWHWWRARTAYRGLRRRSSCRPGESPGPMTSTVRPCSSAPTATTCGSRVRPRESVPP